MWGFGNAIAWKFAHNEGADRKYVRRVTPHESVSDLEGYTGNVTVVYQDLLDINGDGLPDLVRTCDTCGPLSNSWEVYLNNGKGILNGGVDGGFLPQETFTGPRKALTVTTEPDAGVLYTVADMNGDGLPDQVISVWGDGRPEQYTVCLNGGHDTTCEVWPVPARDSTRGTLLRENYDAPQDCIRELVDMNGDGLPDVVDRKDYNFSTNPYWRVFLNRGSGFEETALAWRAPLDFMRRAGDSGKVTKFDTFDLDGDGMVDFVDFFNGSGTHPGTEYAIYHAVNGAWTSGGSTAQPRVTGVRPDLLEVAESGVSSKTTLHYRPSTQWQNGPGNGVVDLPFNVWTVTQVCQDDAMGFGTCDAPDGGHQVGMNIVYDSGKYDPVEREFRGFADVTTTQIASAGAPQRGTVTTYHQQSAASGKVKEAKTYDASGTFDSKPIAKTTNKWECANPTTGSALTLADPNDSLSGCPVHPAGDAWVRLAKVDELTYSNPSTSKDTVTVNEKWNTCGTKIYGNVEDAYRGDSGGSPQVHTHTEYACDDTAYIVDRPTRVVMKASNNSTILEEKWLSYDAKGNLTKIESLIDQGDPGLAPACSQAGSSKCAASTMVYDDRGLLTQVTDPNLHHTTTSYNDQDGNPDASIWLYPETVTRELGQKVTTAYDPKCGRLLSKTIPYTGTTLPAATDTWRYSTTDDHYCRLKTVYRPGEDSGLVAYETYSYSLGNQSVPTATIIDRREPNNSTGIMRSSVLADGLARVIQQKTESVVDGAAKVVATTTAYDSASNLWLQSVPEAFASDTSFDKYTSPSAGFGRTTMLYDAAGRLTRVTHADDKYRAIDHSAAWQTTTNDECYTANTCAGMQLVEKRDALGRTVERWQYDHTTPTAKVLAATKFDYDELGRLTATTQGDGTAWNSHTTVTTQYDSLGRKLKVIDPDAGIAGATPTPTPAPGSWQYGYDPAGNLRYQDDPKTNRHVELCYDNLNRVTKKKYFRTAYSTLDACANNATEQITYTYDGAANGVGRLSDVIDRSGETVIAAYTPLGQLNVVTRKMDGVNALTVYQYDTADHLLKLTYPDGELVQYSYDGVGRVTKMQNGQGGPVYLDSLTYDVFGRPLAITHGTATDTRSYETSALKNYRLKQIKAVAGATTLFQYDYDQYFASARLQHLGDSTAGSLNASADFTYDGMGRLLTANGMASGVGTHAYCYDVWDNIRCEDATTADCSTTPITCTGGTTITYNANKPHQPVTAAGAQTATFTHDDNGNRTGNTVSNGPYTYDYDLDDRLRLLYATTTDGVEYAYDSTGRRTKEKRGPVVADATLGQKVQPTDVGDVTYHYTDFLEVTGGTLRKYYVAGDLLIASRELGAPAALQAVTVSSLGSPSAVQVASLFAGGGPALIVQLGPEAARAVAVTLVLAGGLLLGLPQRRRPAVVGIRLRSGEAIVLAVALTVGTLPWPLLIRPAYAKGGPPPTPTPVPFAQIHHYHLDHLGSPQVVTDGSGGLLQQLRYQPFGKVRIGTFTEEDDRLFSGYEKDAFSNDRGSNLYYAGERFYDADFDLFLSHDPARQFASPYTYTNWNPIGRTDPNGAAADTQSSVDQQSSVTNTFAAEAALDGATVATDPIKTQTGAVTSDTGQTPPKVGDTTVKGNAPTAQATTSSGGPMAGHQGNGAPGSLVDTSSEGQEPNGVESAESRANGSSPFLGAQERDFPQCFADGPGGLLTPGSPVGVSAVPRLPDFVSINVNVAIPTPWTGTLLGVTGALSVDRNFEVYGGVGPSVGKTLTPVSGNVAAGWLNQTTVPTAEGLRNFLTGHGINASAGFWGGGGVTYSPSTGGTATNLGFYTPQVGAGYTYSWEVGSAGRRP